MPETRPAYCNIPASQAVAGKDILLEIYDETGQEFLAVAGQKGLTINRTADTVEVSSKDTAGGWKGYLAGMKEWSIDTDGLYANGESSHQSLRSAFESSNFVCLKIVNGKTGADMFGGLAVIADYSLEAPYDDAMTYSISLSGNGALVDLAGA